MLKAEFLSSQVKADSIYRLISTNANLYKYLDNIYPSRKKANFLVDSKICLNVKDWNRRGVNENAELDFHRIFSKELGYPKDAKKYLQQLVKERNEEDNLLYIEPDSSLSCDSDLFLYVSMPEKNYTYAEVFLSDGEDCGYSATPIYRNIRFRILIINKNGSAKVFHYQAEQGQKIKCDY